MPTSLIARPRAGLCTDRTTIPLEHVDVRADILGAHARVTCVQRYRNLERHPIEAVYVFPLDDAAAVCGFVAAVNGVRLEGQVMPRDEAFAKYDDAMAEGHGAFLLDEERPDVFTASIGNLLPGADVQIEITYVTELAWEGESLRFALPTTVAPRYAPPEDRVAIGRSPDEALNPPRMRDVPYGLAFSARVSASAGVRRVESPSHPIAVDVDDSHATVTLSQEDVALDRDLVLLITARESAGPELVLERGKTGHVAAAVTFRPTFPTSRAPSDVVFVIDRSGSMQGRSIEQVRNALQLCLRSLDEGCRFNIVGFGSAVESLFNECRQYDERSLAEATRYVSSLDATLGGTDMLPALEFVLGSASSTRLLQLIVMTDGQVTNADAVIETVRSRRSQVRVFSFGIGRGASHHLVKGLARASGGAVEFVYPGERIEAKVVRQFRRALSPAFTNVTIDWGRRTTTIPAEVGPVFSDDPLRAFAFLDDVSEGEVTLRATGPNGPLSWRLDVRPAAVSEGNTVGVLAARARIRELEEGGTWRQRGSRQRDRASESVATEIVRLGVEYGLASRETSWVAIERREVPTTGEVVLRKVPIALTSGWGGEDTGQFDRAALPRGDGMVMARMLLPNTMPMPRSSKPGWLSRLRSRLSDRSDNLDDTSVSPFDPGVAVVRGESSSSRALDVIVALQRADGTWDLNEALADALGLPLGSLEGFVSNSGPQHEEARRAWATALALAFLEREASSNRAEWDLLAAKAQRWLSGVSVHPADGGTWSELARKLASASTIGETTHRNGV